MSSNELEYIKHAAIITENDLIIIGKSHADCIHKAIENKLRAKRDAKAQGFFTNTGRYISRFEAAVIAFKAKQIDSPINILFSEDLWSERHNGKFNYDGDMGYYLKKDSGE